MTRTTDSEANRIFNRQRAGKYPWINEHGAMLALKLKLAGKLERNPRASGVATHEDPSQWNAERLAHECSDIVRLARRHTALQVKRCNVQTGEREDKLEARLRERIRNALARLVPATRVWTFDVEFSGDPRGHTVKILWDSHTVWGIA